MFEKGIVCSGCGRDYNLKGPVFRCECGGSLDVVYDYPKMRRSVKRKKLLARPLNHARYAEFYPLRDPLSIQEGATPLVRSHRLEREFRLPFKLWLKYEAQNPTGSFKDRGSSVEVAKALDFRAKKVICASTGNMGASVSAYSGMAGLKCAIVVPQDAAEIKMEQILAYGARVIRITGDYTRAAEFVEYAHKVKGYYLLGDYLWRREGTKSVGFELADQMEGIDYVVCPIGNGTLISAVWKAFQEFKKMGWLARLPRLVGVQAAGCSPVCRAFRDGRPIKPVRGRTVAVAIECGNPMDGERALQAIKDSKGNCVSVTDSEILKARELLAQHEGMFAEPAGAVSLAGILKARKSFKGNARVVSLVTGHGLKTPYTGVQGRPLKIGGSLRALEKHL